MQLGRLSESEIWWSGWQARISKKNLQFKSKGSEAGDPGEIWCYRWSLKTVCWRSLFLQGKSAFCSIPAFRCLNETHPHYGGQLLYLKSTDLNVNLIQNHLPRSIQNDVWPHYLGTVAQPSWYTQLTTMGGTWGLSRKYPATHYEKIETFTEEDTRYEEHCT